MVYLGGSRALTALEMLVHLTTPMSRAKPFRIIEVKIPTDLISVYPLKILPAGWRVQPPGRLTMEIGDDWLRAGSDLALRVPSVIVPEESNILINPLHSEFGQLEVSTTGSFSFDARLQA